MNCTVNHSLFLRSNGSLACWCDYGSLKTLQEFDPLVNYAQDVYLGKIYGYIREKLAENSMPFPSYCSKCMVLQPSLPYVSNYGHDRYVDTFQVEPSMACQLDCPGCIPIRNRKQRVAKSPYGHLLLATKVFEKILNDFQDADIYIRTFDFQGHGEPLINRDVWSMVRMAKSLFPGSYNTLCTNANADFTADALESGLDQIIYAIDGIDQTSYEPYRLYGDFEEAYEFMKTFSTAARAQGKKIDTVWKYVLFRHNDSPEQLLKAQEMALESQITELRFIITQLGPSSTQIIDEEEIPRAKNGVNVQVQNYKVNIKQLRDGILAARDCLNSNRLPQAVQAVEFVAAMMKRLFSMPQTIPSKYAGILGELHELANELPPSARDSVVHNVNHLTV
jgi:hypothetical protein